MSKDKNTPTASVSFTAKMNRQNQKDKEGWDKAFPGYPIYPPSEDIYNKSREVVDIAPENFAEIKEPNEPSQGPNERDFDTDMDGSDLDVPGAELDDEQENIGSEDEENNYYSLGGDNHNDLEEDNG